MILYSSVLQFNFVPLLLLVLASLPLQPTVYLSLPFQSHPTTAGVSSSAKVREAVQCLKAVDWNWLDHDSPGFASQQLCVLRHITQSP